MGQGRARHANGQADACDKDGVSFVGCGGDRLRLWSCGDFAVKNMMRHPDPGLQPERTVMAWTRTLVSFLVVAGLSMRVSASIHDAAFIVITVSAGIAALEIIVCHSGRERRPKA